MRRLSFFFVYMFGLAVINFGYALEAPAVLAARDTLPWGSIGFHKLSGWRFSPEKPARIIDGRSLTGGDTVSMNRLRAFRSRAEWKGYGWFENSFIADSVMASKTWLLSYFSPGGIRIWLNGRFVLQDGNPSPDPKTEVLGKYLFATQTAFALRPGLNTLLFEYSEHTLNAQWAENQPHIPRNFIDLYLIKPSFGTLHRQRSFVFGGAVMLLLMLMLLHSYLAVQFRNTYHKWVAATTFFLLLHAFTTLSNTLISWTWAFAVFHEWVNALAFLFAIVLFVIAVREFYQLPKRIGLTIFFTALASILNVFAIYNDGRYLDILHPIEGFLVLGYCAYSLVEARRKNAESRIGMITGGMLVTFGGALLYVFLYLALGFSNQALFTTSILMAYTGIPVALTLNIASSYAELFRTLERKVKERTADLQASKAELEKSGEYKTRFFANISHEFRTPLTIAQGLVDRISQKRVADVLLQQELQPVKRNMTRLSDMVNQIVDLTKTDNNQLTLHPRNYYGDAVVSIALESFRSLAEYRKQNLTFTADSPRTVVYVDRPKMEIMINNLISNAIKYTPEGGHIDVQTREAGGLYQVIVTDNGRGIPPEEQDAIFERFHRIKQNAEHYVEGMGIGLELSRSLARLHNGDIQLDKTRTEGSRFILILPVSTNTEPVQVEESFFEKDLLEIPETAPANHSFSILLAEDNDDMAGYVSGILSEIGVVTRVRNGVEALAALANTIPDLVITDLMMPEMDGMKLVSQMQKTIAYRKIPVVVLSARALEQDRLDLLRIGVVDYITKPFIAAELLLKTRNLLVLAENRQKAEIVLTTDERALELEKLAPQAAAYVQKHLKDATLSIDLVADHLGISRRTFYRIIEAETGMTGAEFIREVRLQAARSLLTQETTWTLETLSNEVGYASARNFKKLYTERFGAAPTV